MAENFSGNNFDQSFESKEKKEGKINFEKSHGIEKKEKPPVLYVSAQTSGIEKFVPSNGRVRDVKEGPVIFSTPDKALASAFLVEGHNDDWMWIGYFADIPVVLIKEDREQFIQKDKGGIMYSVPSDSFEYDPNKGMGDKEWTSREPVKPLKETTCPSALDEMIKNGVQVYFVDEKTFAEINEAEDYGYSIIAGLKSENEKRGQNIKSLAALSLGDGE